MEAETPEISNDAKRSAFVRGQNTLRRIL